MTQNKITNKQSAAAHLFLLRDHSGVNFNLQMTNDEQTQAYTLSPANNDASVMATGETLEKKRHWPLLSIIARSHFAESTMPHTLNCLFLSHHGGSFPSSYTPLSKCLLCSRNGISWPQAPGALTIRLNIRLFFTAVLHVM